MKKVNVIGAGLAGCEAAYCLAKAGYAVHLYEMKPLQKSPAHHSDTFAELVCSNSLKSDDVTSACGLLKEEMRLLDSLIISCADQTRVPAGGALAVDRKLFSEKITQKIKECDGIEVHCERVTEIPNGKTIIATGPLTDDGLIPALQRLCGKDFLYFYDAAAPIVSKESIDFNSAFVSSRYGKGTDDYVNCPMNEAEFFTFWPELTKAKTAQVKDFEETAVFEGCMPIEVMAKRGVDTIRFGPLKPVGLRNPKTDKRPYAVLQLRKEDVSESMYNLVGSQTHPTCEEQRRVFSLIPALKNAEFLRYGVMHRNTYLNAPELLTKEFRLKTNEDVYFAGQITGVEGYVESAASGLVAAMQLIAADCGKTLDFTQETMTGALSCHVATLSERYQPMNSNFGILQPLPTHISDKSKRKEAFAERALRKIKEIKKEFLCLV